MSKVREKELPKKGREFAKTVSKNSSMEGGTVDGEDWITISSAANLYGCSYVNVYNHLRKGNLKSAKIKGVKHVRKSDVLALMKLNGR